MTKTEAVIRLSGMIGDNRIRTCADDHEALRMAIEALVAPPVERKERLGDTYWIVPTSKIGDPVPQLHNDIRRRLQRELLIRLDRDGTVTMGGVSG